MNKLGFVGMGNMATALCSGFIKSGLISGEDVYGYAPHFDKLKKNAEKYGFVPKESLVDMVKECDTIILACKPYQIEEVLKELGDAIEHKAIISVALGWNYDKLDNLIDADVRLQFVMPNTPAMVGEGVLLFEDKNSLLPEEREEIMKLFGSVGLVEEMASELMGIGGAVTGCGPAFVDLMMEAYADVAVKYGVKRDVAYKLVGQLVLGSAKLMLETGEHPAVLKDNVCSPGGSTIKGVTALEKAGFRNACIESIDSIMN